MKGIKECLNFMLDNPMVEIKTEWYQPCRFNDADKCFEYKANYSEEWYYIEGDDFEIFDKCEWVINEH